jgi:hypothetical protein
MVRGIEPCRPACSSFRYQLNYAISLHSIGPVPCLGTGFSKGSKPFVLSPEDGNCAGFRGVESFRAFRPTPTPIPLLRRYKFIITFTYSLTIGTCGQLHQHVFLRLRLLYSTFQTMCTDAVSAALVILYNPVRYNYVYQLLVGMKAFLTEKLTTAMITMEWT